jgi:hypothetical protein
MARFEYTVHLHRLCRVSMLTAALLSGSMLVLGCGGGGSSTGGGTTSATNIVDSFGDAVGAGDSSGVGAGDSGADGTAGEGKALVGATITITDANGRIATAVTDARGYYRAKVTGFTAPMVAKASLGTTKVFYAVGTLSPVTNTFVTFNVTGLTDKIASDVAVAAGRTGSAAITPAIVAANLPVLATAKSNLRAALSAQLTANGIDPATFEPSHTRFRADHTGYDAVLDTTLVSRSGSGSTQITPGGQQYLPGLDTTGIATLVSEFNRLNKLQTDRSSAVFADLVDANYLDSGLNKLAFLSSFVNSTNTLNASIINPKFLNCSIAAAVCDFQYKLVSASGVSTDVTGQKVKLNAGVWRLYGNQSAAALPTPTPTPTPAPAPAPVGFTNYTYFSLLGTPLLENTVAINNTATIGTLSLSADTFTYLADPVLGLVSTNAPYTFLGSTKQTGFMICKPANTIAGAVAGVGIFAKSIYTLLPANATLGTIDDLKGKTLDAFEDCGAISASVVFDSNANARFFSGSALSGTNTAAEVSSALSSAGFTDAFSTTRLKVYKVGAAVVMVERGVPLTGATSNTNGYLTLLVSR